MRVNFQKVIIDNFMSLGHVELLFNNDGFIRVSGLNQSTDDNSNSNGSGKSSLWEAIIWAITGDTIRGTKQVSNINCDDGAVVDLELCVDDDHYRIVRSKDHSVRKTNLVIVKNDTDVSGKGIRDSEKLLKQYLPDLTSSFLGSVIILGQGLPHRFTNNTPSGRKEVLEQLSKSDFMIEDLKSRVTTRRAELTDQHKQYCDAILKDQTQENLLRSQIEKSKQALESLITSDDNIIELKKQEEVTSLEKIQQLKNYIESEDKELAEKNNTLYTITEAESLELRQLGEKFIQDVQVHRDTAAELSATLRLKKNSLKELQQITDVCPTCGQKLTNVHKPDISALESEVKTLEENITLENNIIKRIEKNYNDLSIEVKKKYFDKKQEAKFYVETLSENIKKLKRDLETASNKHTGLINFITELEKKLSQKAATIDFHNKIIIENNEKINLLEDQIMYNIVQRDLTASRLEVISKFDTSLKRDFRGYLLSTVIEYIEQRAKYYSETIFSNSNVSFVLDGNNIDIRYMSKSYENLSGGEKQKIDLIVQFSIRDMLSAQLGFSSNILVLDEVFDGLDAKGCNKVIDMIASVPDVKNIFIITHRKDLSIPTDKELIVVKSPAGISEIGL